MALWTRMLEAARSKSRAEWEAIFDSDHDVFAEPFRHGEQILDHPQLLHDGMVTDLDDRERGVVRQPGPLVKAAGTPADITRSAPRLDERRVAILAEIADAGGSQATEHSGSTETSGLPLAGITILELAVLFAAPQGPAVLTDLGAQVIKVEPMAGDPIRTIVSFPESGGVRAMHGKQSICVDLTTPEGKALVQDIAARVDVVVQGFRAGAAQRLGLDDRSVRARNPDVVYVNAPGYGVDGPYGGRPAFAPSIAAAAGIPLANLGASLPVGAEMSIAEIQDGARRLSASGTTACAQADGVAALAVATAISFGVLARERGAGGQELFTSMVNTGAHMMANDAVRYPGGPDEPAVDVELRGFGPLYRIYDAAAGHVMLAAPSASDWERLCGALGPELDLAADARFVGAEARRLNAPALIEVLQEVFARRPAAEWERELLACGVGCVEVRTTGIEAFLLDDPVARESGYVTDIVHPTFDEFPRTAPYIRFSRSRTQTLPGSLAGQHTDAILTGLGRDADEIADLRARRIVG